MERVGSCMSSRDIRHLNSSGMMIGDVCFMETANVVLSVSVVGAPSMTMQSLIFLSKDDISPTQPS